MGARAADQQGPHTTADIVHRTSGFNYAGFASGGPLFLVALASFRFNHGIHDRGIYMAGTVVVFLLLVAYAVVMSPRLKQETLTVDGDRLIYKSAWQTRAIDVRDGHAVDLPYKMGGFTYRRWLFLNEKGVVSLRLKVGPWAHTDLTNLAAALGLPVESVQEAIKPRKARRTYPGSWSWPGAHPGSSFFLAVFGALMIYVIIYAIVAGPSS
jgi:hypothetical protein